MNALQQQLREVGFVHVRGDLDRVAYRQLAMELGVVLAEETIALRPGAHAYVAKPGPVPLHTDHPDVAVIGWLCEEQDALDGASQLLDARPVLEQLEPELRERLRRVALHCPPLAGGPPTLQRRVLTATADGEALFCSPWLQAASPLRCDQEALDELRSRLTMHATRATHAPRLARGDALFIDNRRVLHGRRAIGSYSGRRLHRLWLG